MLESTTDNNVSLPTLVSGFGDSPNTNPTVFRYVFQNINGTFKTDLQKNTTLEKILLHEPDIIGFAEPNLNWTRLQRHSFNLVLSDHWANHRSIFSHCPPTVSHTSDSLQGGILQSMHGQHSGRIRHYHEDNFGRWNSHTMRLKNNQKLTIITSYRPQATPLLTPAEVPLYINNSDPSVNTGLPPILAIDSPMTLKSSSKIHNCTNTTSFWD
mmetsp:Transcript_5448/g.8348  ORF Transcript_5448/g.8348 Transcript_5448/m.8348 type:complete len:212 (-) Transcript_5448:855-1490(-)